MVDYLSLEDGIGWYAGWYPTVDHIELTCTFDVHPGVNDLLNQGQEAHTVLVAVDGQSTVIAMEDVVSHWSWPFQVPKLGG